MSVNALNAKASLIRNTHTQKVMYLLGDKNSVTKGPHEPNFAFPPKAVVHYLLIHLVAAT